MAKFRLDRLSATSSKEPYCPKQYDVIHIQFDPQVGREMAGKHYAFVLTDERYNRLTRLCVLCPITSKVKGFPFEVAIPNGGKMDGVVLADQVKSLDWSMRQSEFVEHRPDIEPEILGKLRALLSMQ